jgi:DNA polymerase
MNLTREQLLAEMGLTPQWKLREQPTVVREMKRTLVAAPVAAAPEVVSQELLQATAAVTPGTNESGGRVDRLENRLETAGWAELRQNIVECRACELCKERQLVVPGVGDEQADWMFIGEGPGAEEDEQGLPFVGPAGRLLDAMLSAIDLKRGDNVYITNVVKCRPPGNRTPKESEIAACLPYLKRQIAMLRPKLIVLLGRVAVQGVLGEDVSVGSLRGKVAIYRDGERSIPVVVTYHPAYLLRTLPDKAKAWEDLCLARQVMRRSAAAE